jgi:iron complex outermembrane receptor protein
MREYRRSIRSRTALLAGASLATFAAAQPALAQAGETQSADTAATTEIVVTAQFREQRLQDTPLAITAVDAATMEAKNQTNLAQVADSAPNVTVRPQSGAFGPSVSASIRGVGQNDFNPAFEPGVGIYIDDVYYPQLTGAVFDVLDLERVEILRGPQGTLSGRNSLGGAIKLYSRKPSGESRGFVEAAYGSRHLLSLRAAADFAITDTLFARVSGVSKQQDGYVDQLDFGCVYPAGGGETFVDSTGTTREVNPAGGIPARAMSGDCKVGELGGIDYKAARGILRWTPTPDLDVSVTADYTRDDRTVPGEVLLDTVGLTNPNIVPPGIAFDERFICGRYCNFQQNSNPAANYVALIPGDPFGANGTPMVAFDGNNRSFYEGWGVSGHIEYQLSDIFSLVSITGYREFDTQFFSDPDLSPVTVQAGDNDLTNWSVSQEIRLNAELADSIFATIGGYYFEQKSTYNSVQDIRYTPAYPLQFVQPDPTSADAKAVFANVSWEVVPDLNVSGGLRYTEESKEQTYYRLNFDGTVNHFLDPFGAAYGIGYVGPDTLDVNRNGNTTETVTALSGLTATYADDSIDYRVSVDYRFIPEVMAYATVSTGFKGGGSNPRPFNAGQVISFGPETLTAYELGLKTDLFDRRVRFNVAAFYNDYEGIQIAIASCPDTPCAARLNAGDAKVKGFEAELFATPIDNLSIDAALSYLDFSYVEGSLDPRAAQPPAGVNPGGIAVTDPGPTPRWKASTGIQYKFDLGNAGSLTPRVDVIYQDKQYAGAANLPEGRILNFIPEFTLVNARVAWQNVDEDLTLALEVSNLTDEYYFLSMADTRPFGSGFRSAQPGRPREWSFTVRKNF